MSIKPPKILDTREVARSRIFTIEEVDLEFSNGEQRTYERFNSQGYQRGGMMVVPINANDEFVLLREYANGMDRYELNFPKGIIDPGEEPIVTANRELQEEAGFAAADIRAIKTVGISPSYMKNKMYFYVAQDLTPSQLEGDEPEPMEVVTWPVNDYKSLLAHEHFTGALSISALFLALEKLGRLHVR